MAKTITMTTKRLAILVAAVLLGLMLPGTARAADILCENVLVNHMLIDDSYVSACLDAGIGNINGNEQGQNPDLFLTGVGGAYEFISAGGFTQNGSTGTFSFSPTLWNSFSDIAIGFKFGTGNQADEWFVYSLNSLVSSGNWTFVNVFGTGGGLSHVNLYGIEGTTPVPEPASVALLLLGIAGVGAAARRRRAV